MRILALESSGTSGSVAVAEGGRLLAEQSLAPDQRSAQSLAPALQAILRQVGWRPGDVQLVACAAGPGSFTGLRVGVTTAKAFAYAAGTQIIGVNTLETIAWQSPEEVCNVAVAIDAHRGEVFAGDLQRDPETGWQWLRPTGIEGVESWLARLPAGTVVSGPVVDKLGDRLPAGITAVAQQRRWPLAGTVARLAAHRYAAGQRDDVFQLVPLYLRRSAAEEKRDAAQNPAAP